MKLRQIGTVSISTILESVQAIGWADLRAWGRSRRLKPPNSITKSERLLVIGHPIRAGINPAATFWVEGC
jgi:hypothetical protein